jgi:hypothetical protein
MRALFALALLLGGCFNPDYPNGGLVCAAGSKPCPDGYHCVADHSCWRNGQSPDLGSAPANREGVVGINGGGGIVAGAQYQGGLIVGQPIVGTTSSSSRNVQLGLLPAAQSK